MCNLLSYIKGSQYLHITVKFLPAYFTNYNQRMSLDYAQFSLVKHSSRVPSGISQESTIPLFPQRTIPCYSQPKCRKLPLWQQAVASTISFNITLCPTDNLTQKTSH